MNRRNAVGILGMMIFALGWACAQDNAPSSDSAAPQQPVAAYGQENSPSTPITDNPPLSGLDLPSLQEHAAPLSYLQPGATFSESASTNIGNTVGGSDFGSITRGLGTLDLRRLWSHYDLALDYMGGVAYYNKGGIGWRQLQSLGIGQKIEWKRGQLSLRDNFSYLPEGNFGASYGSLGSVGTAGIGSVPGGLWGGNASGALGLAPRILNVAIGELSESLSPKSSVTATGGYSFTHFYGNDFSGVAFIGSSQFTAQGGYNRTLTPHTQIAAVYGYQDFDFTVIGTAFHSHVIQGMYGHRLSGRMDLLLGAGPQFTEVATPCTVFDALGGNPHCSLGTGGVAVGSIPNTKLGVAAQARLRYRLSRNSLDLRYERFVTSGGGLFAGAESDMVRFGLEHPLSRVWNLSLDVGVSRNNRLQPLTADQLAACNSSTQTPQSACPARNATTSIDGYAGAALHRYFGRTFHGFLSYQFSELSFDHSYCVPGLPCDHISNRHVVTFGLDWTPRPIRID
jgi:hypothetical protein